MTDNQAVTEANPRGAGRTKKSKNNPAKSKSSPAPLLPEQPENSAANQDPQDAVNQEASDTPILDSELVYEQVEYYEAGDLVFLPVEDYLWPGKVVKPLKDYRSYRVKHLEGKKVETRPFAELLDYTHENYEKCEQLFARNQRDQNLQKSLMKALTTAETAHKKLLRQEEQAKQAELVQKDRAIEDEIFQQLLREEKEKHPFDAGVEQEYNNLRKGKKPKNYPRIIEFAQRKAQHEKDLEEVARKRALQLRQAKEQAKEARDEAVSNREVSAQAAEAHEPASNNEIASNREAISNHDNPSCLENASNHQIASNHEVGSNLAEENIQEHQSQPQERHDSQREMRVSAEEGDESSIIINVEPPKQAEQSLQQISMNANPNESFLNELRELGNSMMQAEEVEIERPEDSLPHQGIEIAQEQQMEIELEFAPSEDPISNNEISPQKNAEPAAYIDPEPIQPIQPRIAEIAEPKSEELPPFKVFFPMTPPKHSEQKTDYPTGAGLQLRSPRAKTPQQCLQEMRSAAFLSRYEEIELGMGQHLQSLASMSEDELVELCETAIDRTTKALTEPQPGSASPSFLRLLGRLLLGQIIPVQRVLASRILTRMALFVRIYEGIVRDSAFIAEYNFFAGFCRTVRERCRAGGVEMQRRAEELLEKARFSD